MKPKALSYAPAQDVVERLRELEGRLDTLSGGAGFSVQSLRGALALDEANRGKQYAEALRQASGFAREIARAVDTKLEKPLSLVADRAAGLLRERPFPEVVREHKRVAELEEGLPGLLEYFADLRRSVEVRGDKLDAAIGRVDELWRQQETPGLGAWRVVMRAASEQVEFEKNQQPAFTERHRGKAAREMPLSLAPGLGCARCNNATVRRVTRETMLEEAMRLVWLAPYRCWTCSARSYRFRNPVIKGG